MGDRQLKWVVACAGVLTILGVGVSLGLSRVDYALGIAVGGAIALGNLWVLARMTRRMMASQKAGASAGLFLVKMGLLFGAIYAAFKLIPMNLFGFILGLSVVVLAVTLSAILGPVNDGGDAVETE